MISVVIIDDNKPMADRISNTVPWKEMDCEVVAVAYDGLSGKKAIVQYLPDLIITDVRMPNLSGLEMIELTRKLIPDSLVIFISAYDEFEYAYRAIKLKAADCLVKPFTQAELIKTIQNALSSLRGRESGPKDPKYIQEDQDKSGTVAQKALDYFVHHLSEHITLDELSRIFEVSPNYLSKLVQQETGQRFSEWAVHQRIEKAKTLLLNGECRVSETGEMVGYSNYLTFYKVFTKVVGVSPTEYIKNSGCEQDGK